jgi:hypothetical protein
VRTITREPTLKEVMVDPDFLIEAKMSNELLCNYMNRTRVLEMVDFVIKDPEFEDDPDRCYKLPVIACECLMSDQMSMFTQHLFAESTNDEMSVLEKLISFYYAPEPKY